MAQLCDLPNELLDEIFSHLPSNSLAHLTTVCKQIRDPAERQLYRSFEAAENETQKIRLLLRTIVNRPELVEHMRSATFGDPDSPYRPYGRSKSCDTGLNWSPNWILEDKMDACNFICAATAANVPDVNAIFTRNQERIRDALLQLRMHGGNTQHTGALTPFISGTPLHGFYYQIL